MDFFTEMGLLTLGMLVVESAFVTLLAHRAYQAYKIRITDNRF